MVYLDDIIIFSDNIDEHLKQIEQILTVLRQARMTPRLNKCFFMQKRIEYLGHIVKTGELYVANKVIEEMEPPGTTKQLRLFLGMCNAYRPPILALNPTDLPYILYTDADEGQIGYVLSQRHGLKE